MVVTRGGKLPKSLINSVTHGHWLWDRSNQCITAKAASLPNSTIAVKKTIPPSSCIGTSQHQRGVSSIVRFSQSQICNYQPWTRKSSFVAALELRRLHFGRKHWPSSSHYDCVSISEAVAPSTPWQCFGAQHQPLEVRNSNGKGIECGLFSLVIYESKKLVIMILNSYTDWTNKCWPSLAPFPSYSSQDK